MMLLRSWGLLGLDQLCHYHCLVVSFPPVTCPRDTVPEQRQLLAEQHLLAWLQRGPGLQLVRSEGKLYIYQAV